MVNEYVGGRKRTQGCVSPAGEPLAQARLFFADATAPRPEVVVSYQSRAFGTTTSRKNRKNSLPIIPIYQFYIAVGLRVAPPQPPCQAFHPPKSFRLKTEARVKMTRAPPPPTHASNVTNGRRSIRVCGQQGYAYYDGGDQDGERDTGGANDHQVQEKKELLGVRGLCLMKGTLLAMVDW